MYEFFASALDGGGWSPAVRVTLRPVPIEVKALWSGLHALEKRQFVPLAAI